MKFIQAKRVQFVLDFLDLFLKDREKVFLLEKLVERYEKRCGEVLRDLEERINANREAIEENAVLSKELKKKSLALKKKIQIQEQRLQEIIENARL